MLPRFLLALILFTSVQAKSSRYVMYLTGQHNVVPDLPLVSDITHVVLAFMPASIFIQDNPAAWPLFATVPSVRLMFPVTTAIMVAIGGWGDTDSFSFAAATSETRQRFANNIKRMVDATGADGVDIDWEYPGGNGEDYQQVPNSAKTWEIQAFPELLQEIRSALGPHKLISAAVPGNRRDMLAFTEDTMSRISAAVDFLNIMTYDLVNRRDNVTGHHAGIVPSLDGVNAYLARGLEPEKANLGFAFYPRWYRTDPNGSCSVDAVSCKTVLMEDPVSGADLGHAGAFAWSDEVPNELASSFDRAMHHGQHDDVGGGQYFQDVENNLFWSWETPQSIINKFTAIVPILGLGGVFAWGLGEDSADWSHLLALTSAFRGHIKTTAVQHQKDEL